MKTCTNASITSKHPLLTATLFTILLAAGLLTGVLPAAPAQSIYTDRGSFNAAVASASLSVATEGYEPYPNDVQNGPRMVTLNQFKVSYDRNDDCSGFGVTDDLHVDGGGGYGPTEGTKFLIACYPQSGRPSGTVTFLFGAPIKVFGTDFKDLEVADLTYSTSSGASGTAAFLGEDSNIQFFGIISNVAFTSIGFTEQGASGGDAVSFDKTVFSVPEPSQALFGLIGVPGIALLGIRHKQRTKRASIADAYL